MSRIKDSWFSPKLMVEKSIFFLNGSNFKINGIKIRHFRQKFEKIWKTHREIQVWKSGHPASTSTNTSSRTSLKTDKFVLCEVRKGSNLLRTNFIVIDKFVKFFFLKW
jgi:hypothetical protein